MGFHSWLCKGCKQSIRNVYSGEASWMFQVVTMRANGDRMFGAYDGYGSVGDIPIDKDLIAGDVEVWHRICWDAAERPEYTGPSEDDPEQGHFGPSPRRDACLNQGNGQLKR